MTRDQFDELIDEATHSVNNLIPDEVLAKMSGDQRSALLVSINDALTGILSEIIPQTPEDMG